jgi:hypothetical protein
VRPAESGPTSTPGCCSTVPFDRDWFIKRFGETTIAATKDLVDIVTNAVLEQHGSMIQRQIET